MTDTNMDHRPALLLFIFITLIFISITQGKQENYEFINAPCTVRITVPDGEVAHGVSSHSSRPDKNFLIKLNQTVAFSKQYQSSELSNDRQLTYEPVINTIYPYVQDICNFLILSRFSNRSPPLI